MTYPDIKISTSDHIYTPDMNGLMVCKHFHSDKCSDDILLTNIESEQSVTISHPAHPVLMSQEQGGGGGGVLLGIINQMYCQLDQARQN